MSLYGEDKNAKRLTADSTSLADLKVRIKCAQANLYTFTKALILRKYTDLLAHTLILFICSDY